MADEEKKEEKKDSRPNSAKSDKSHKSDKSDKSHKSDKSDKSHKSDKSDKSHKSHKSDKSHKSHKSEKAEKKEEEAVPPQEPEVVPAADNTPPAETEVAAAEQAVQESVPEPEQAQTVTTEPEPVRQETTEPEPVRQETTEPEPVQKEPSALERACSSVADLSVEERDRFEALFEVYATEDGTSGVKKLTTSGIKLLFRFMGEIINEAILCQWLKEEDKDVDGMFDFEEFCSLYKKKRQPEDKRKEDLMICVNKLFPVKDGNDETSLSLDQVSTVVKYINTLPCLKSEKTSVLTDSDVDGIISKADVDGSKTISRQEFVNFLCSLE